jgi:steroid delta-isomerase-like uncharacterized protein
MTHAEAAALIARQQGAWNAHDYEAFASIYANDCVVDSPTAGGVVTGLAAIQDINRAWWSGFPDVRLATEELVVDGYRIAAIVTARGTDTGGFMGLPPTGKPFALPMVILSTVDGEAIRHERRIYDFTGMLIQIGVLKAKATAGLRSLPLPHVEPTTEGDGALPREQIETLLAAWHTAWARRDVDAVVAQHADGAVMDTHIAGRANGRREIRAVYERWWAGFPDSVMTPEETLVDGNRIVDVVTQSGTDTGGFLGLASTGKPFRLSVVWRFVVTQGVFSYVCPIYDFTGLLVQIGVLKVKPV